MTVACSDDSLVADSIDFYVSYASAVAAPDGGAGGRSDHGITDDGVALDARAVDGRDRPSDDGRADDGAPSTAAP
ncbi:hypothetical protein JL720_999 [Aureococcus anophagefferens]|nr:hypothetical protein JL720_999 [Aureococcus anophagefferens]